MGGVAGVANVHTIKIHGIKLLKELTKEEKKIQEKWLLQFVKVWSKSRSLYSKEIISQCITQGHSICTASEEKNTDQ